MEITYYGHASFGLKIGNHQLLFDPFITQNPLAKNVDIKKIQADFVLLSHAHSDHIGDALEIRSNNPNAVLICNNEMKKWFAAKGWENSYGMNYGSSVKFDFGKVRLVNAIHSSVFPDGTSGGNPAGFVIETSEGNFYYAGDTALTMDMKLIPMHTPIDFALLPIGGFYTMDYHDAAIAADLIECKKIVGMHYDTFPVIKIDQDEARKSFEAKGQELILMKIGETIAF
jgi:L-ascorbate metabolism protein UlaG (beta-lactamase superfamily)